MTRAEALSPEQRADMLNMVIECKAEPGGGHRWTASADSQARARQIVAQADAEAAKQGGMD